MDLFEALYVGEAKAEYDGLMAVVNALNYRGIDLPGSTQYALYVDWVHTESVAWPREDFVTLDDVNCQLEKYGMPPHLLDWQPVISPDEEHWFCTECDAELTYGDENGLCEECRKK